VTLRKGLPVSIATLSFGVAKEAPKLLLGILILSCFSFFFASILRPEFSSSRRYLCS
jgi:hypothetical protein